MTDDNTYQPRNPHKNIVVLAVIGFVGLLAETIGVGLLFAWWQEVPRSLTDPRIFVGGVLTVIGFVIIIRGFSWIVKQIILMTIAEN